ncbi:PREDICTED: uncharacterized protein LOC102259499 [Myotis brandtii]|uniref:uncharacterized protein LOC102259499 n=1 Tax=Myotis brandtii TaxID=109478 RepID=UPI0003BBA359|nr:PREDICTED: uncharacterized protein LOC102259499 [Myotis brandtii]
MKFHSALLVTRGNRTLQEAVAGQGLRLWIVSCSEKSRLRKSRCEITFKAFPPPNQKNTAQPTGAISPPHSSCREAERTQSSSSKRTPAWEDITDRNSIGSSFLRQLCSRDRHTAQKSVCVHCTLDHVNSMTTVRPGVEPALGGAQQPAKGLKKAERPKKAMAASESGSRAGPPASGGRQPLTASLGRPNRHTEPGHRGGSLRAARHPAPLSKQRSLDRGAPCCPRRTASSCHQHLGAQK